MTVNTTTITSGPYTAAGGQTIFDYTFRADVATDLDVYVNEILRVDYTVSGLGDDDGGQIQFITGLTAGDKVYIRSSREATQDTEFSSQGGFYPEEHERAFDKLTFLIQQLGDKIKRTLRIADTKSEVSIVDLVAGKFIQVNGTADGFQMADTPTITPTVESWVNTFADLATTAATVDIVQTRGHTVAGLGSRKYIKTAGSVVSDGGTQINSATPSYYWRLINERSITPEVFGCISTSTAVDTTRAINKAVVYGAANGLPVMFEQMAYALDGNVDGTIDGATSPAPGQGRGGIQVKTNSHIIFSGQVFTQVASPYTAYSLVNFSAAENFIVEGPAEFIGDMLIHGPTGGEFGHGLYICNAHNGRISDLYVRNCWGDGAYVSDTDFTSLANGTATASKNITITNCVFDNNRRQGMSGINGQYITWNNCKFVNTGQTLSTSPASGVDLETDANPNRIGMQHWQFNNCLMDGNVGPSVLIFPTLNNGLPGCFDIEFNECTMTNTEAQGSFWSDRAYPFVDNIRVNGGYIGGGVYSGNATRFNGVTIERNMLDVGGSVYAVEFIATSFGASFDNCKIVAGGDTTVNSKKLLFLPVGPTDEKKPTFNKCRFVADDTYGGATNLLLITRAPITFTECEFTTEGTAPASYVGFDTTAGNSRVGLPIYAMLYDCWISTTWHIGYTTLQGRVNFLSTKIRSIAATGTNAVPISTGADIFEFVYATGGASTISAPTDPYQKLITITIKCTGGVMGTTTWNAAYKMAAWTNPATGFSRSITFRYDGTNWIEVSRTTADVPN